MVSFGGFLKQYDLFGHAITFNFDKRGGKHQTPIGGFFSILIKITIFSYVALTLKRMLWYEADINFTEFGNIDLVKAGEINLFKTDIVIFYNLFKQRSGEFFLDQPDLERYLSVKFRWALNNYTQDEDGNIKDNHPIKEFPARKCR